MTSHLLCWALWGGAEKFLPHVLCMGVSHSCIDADWTLNSTQSISTHCKLTTYIYWQIISQICYEFFLGHIEFRNSESARTSEMYIVLFCGQYKALEHLNQI